MVTVVYTIHFRSSVAKRKENEDDNWSTELIKDFFLLKMGETSTYLKM